MIRVSVIFGGETRKSGLDSSNAKVRDALFLADVTSPVNVTLNDRPATLESVVEDGDIIEATPISGKVG